MYLDIDELAARAAEFHVPGALTLACIAFDPRDYDRRRLELHIRLTTESATAGSPVGVYPGSDIDNCGTCNIRVAVGPAQLAAMASAKQHDIPVNVFCLICGGVLQLAVGGDVSGVIELGNTYVRKP